MAKNTLSQIKQYIDKHVGLKVRLEASGRNNTSIVNEGILINAYPSIFTIKVGKEQLRTISYSYTDILINNISITPCD